MSKTWCFSVAMLLSAAALPLSAADLGWAVGNGGIILHTSNGGAAWSPQTSGIGNILFGVSFVDANNGWAVGDSGAIVHTSDGGVTWSSQTSGTGTVLLGVSFVDANNGWAVGQAGTILHTSDGGVTWAAQTSGTGNILFGVTFVDANSGWVVGTSGVLLHTSNGGVTWSPQTSGTGSDLAGASFLDANNGWAAGASGAIVHTSNGGATWSPQTSGTINTLFGVSFVDANSGWAVGDGGTIVHTSDGGGTWSPQTSGTGNTLFGVTFLDANNGWAVGATNTILHTSDGGATWSPQATGGGITLRAVSFIRQLAPPASSSATLDGPFQVSAFGNLTAGTQIINVWNGGANGTGTNIFTGPTTTNGNICVNVYVFDATDEQEIACCSCLLTPNEAAQVSAAQLISKTLELVAPTSIVVKLIATDAGAATSCTPATAGSVAPTALVNGMMASGTHIHTAPGAGFVLTETLFTPATLSLWEFTRATTLCTFIVGNQSGSDQCPGCTLGVLGAARK